jgi:hypothetical protein
MSDPADTLELRTGPSGPRYHLAGRPVTGGAPVQLCFSGGWVTGRFEWTREYAEAPKFHASIELEGGKVHALAFDLPEGALLRWPED